MEVADYPGDVSFLEDLPAAYRAVPSASIHRETAPYGCSRQEGGTAHADVALAWWLHKHRPDLIEVDIIRGAMQGATDRGLKGLT